MKDATDESIVPHSVDVSQAKTPGLLGVDFVSNKKSDAVASDFFHSRLMILSP